MPPTLTVDPHPLFAPALFLAKLPVPLGQLPSPQWLQDALAITFPNPLPAPDDTVRSEVRELLRHGGYKPTGRGKPASEYLLRTAQEGGVRTINAVVDACNAASLHSGLPISVVDLAHARGPFRLGLAPEGAQYVFNASGQTIELQGLLCLFDEAGPCANAVKDAQRTKTSDATTEVLVVVWGTGKLPGRAAATATFYRGLLDKLGAITEELHPS